MENGTIQKLLKIEKFPKLTSAEGDLENKGKKERN